jgi:hypothetical protein
MKKEINFFACAPPACKCPQVICMDGDEVIIVDDDGKVVNMRASQLDVLAEKWLEERK